MRDGELFTRVVKEIETGSMPPPDLRPPLSMAEKDTLTTYINKYLGEALAENDPGIIAPRKLNNREYRYTVQDLFGVKINTDSIFPSEASGGGGFDNQARVLFLSPLGMERYFEAAELVLDLFYQDTQSWRNMIPAYKQSLGESLRIWWNKKWNNRDLSLEGPQEAARKAIFPIAIKAYRRFLTANEKSTLISFFTRVYQEIGEVENRFDLSIKETLKIVLMSHHFLYRQEADPDIKGAYQITNFELASRLSYFLWSSIPDETLLQVAYKEDLHDPEVLRREVRRMLRDPKAQRMGESFAIQWLELKKLRNPDFQMDPDRFPDFDVVLKELMLKEIELFFNNVLLETQNFLDLIDSDYSFLNKTLAEHYGINGVEGEEMQQVCFDTDQRGGVMGMGGVLTATSLAVRTSPVLRGKWVLERILGTPAKPPPPNVPELEATGKAGHEEMSLREMLMIHREDPACISCHLEMDPLGLGLENFDAVGRWREEENGLPIDASGVLVTGESFDGPAELRKILLSKRELFARNLSKKMLSYALGRSLQFKDTPTIKHLTETLINSNFHTETFIEEIVISFPFRFKKSDRPKPTSET